MPITGHKHPYHFFHGKKVDKILPNLSKKITNIGHENQH